MTTKKVNERFDLLNFKDRVLREAAWSWTVELFEGTGGGCAPVIQGDPLDLRNGLGIYAKAKAFREDDDEDLECRAGLPFKGDGVDPAIVTLRMTKGNVARCLAPGALGRFAVTVFAIDALGDSYPIINGTVTVSDSAAGGV